ncbi:MAG TPA: metal-dependent hydrolase [Desulfobulbaceae bacterium]|nr:metal-dependent hydrolase [Desulfobulbaceae bacterium]
MKLMTGLAVGTLLWTCMVFAAHADEGLEKDTIATAAGNVEITFIGHGSLMLQFQGKVIHIDPFSKAGDYTALPKADLILLTHHHQDHLDETALNAVRTEKTDLLLTEICAEKVSGGMVMRNGDRNTVQGIRIEAVPAYNLVHKRDNGQFFHPKGEGNGYVLTFGETMIYIAGDTENTPEMKALQNIAVAFLPMNLPYTMTPEMVADAALAFRPKVLYPYHFGETDTSRLIALLKDAKDIEVRIRRMP